MREDWVECRFGNVCDFEGGGTPSKRESSYWGGRIPWASIKDIKGDFLHGTLDSITEEGLKNSSSKLAREGDIILATRINPGKPILSKIDVAINQDLKVVKPRIEIDTEYLFYLLKSLEKRISRRSSGTTVLGISVNSLRDFDFPLAPLPEQRAIVAKIENLFSELDQGIADLKKAQAQLKVYRQAVLKKAFEGQLTKVWRELNNINFNWEETSTGEVMDNINSGSTPKAKFLSESGEIQFLKVYNLNFDGTLNQSKNPAFTTHQIHTTTNKRAICIAGDVLINIVGPPLGKVSMIPENLESEFNINQAIVRFRPNDKIIPKFLSFFMQNPMTINWLEGTSKATAGQYNVKVSTCRVIPMLLPSVIEQHQIVREIESRLSVCDSVEQSIEESLAKAEALRQSILKKAFEGTLLTEAEIAACKAEKDYQPASELLKKIKGEKKEKKKTKK